MEVEINMINVEDGDAIIVILRNEGKSDVIVIDGGEKYFNERVKKRLDQILKQEGDKKGPDLLICTHIDSDHILGCINIVKEYGNEIGEIWAFHPSKYLSQKIDEFAEVILREEKRDSIRGWGNYYNLMNENLVKEGAQLYESYTQLLSLYKLLDAIKYNKKVKEPVMGRTFKDYPFKLIFPNLNFFDQCINQKNKFGANIISMAKRWKVNRASAVCLLTNGSDKYLFTGDADKTTLQNIPNKETVINDLKFLDVPHHGSIANINEALVDIMKPNISFISAVNDTHHPSNDVKSWLQKYGKVQVTNEDANTWYLKLDKDGKFERVLE